MDTKDDKQASFGYWERRAVEQDAELHKGIKKPENTILIAYAQAQEYLKAEAKNIYDRYSAQPGMNEDMMHDLLNAEMASNDLSDLIAMLKVTKDKQVRKQIQRYLNAMAAKARITRLEMLRAKAYVVAKQLADVQLRQETDFLSKAVQASYKQAAVEAIIGQANHDVQVKAPRSFPGASKLPNVIEFNDPDTGEAIKTIELHPDKPTKVFKQLSTSQTRAVLNIKWVGGNYSSRIWKNTDHLADRLGELFTAQQMSGMSERDMIAALQKEFQVGAYVARRLIRTEANFVAGQAKLMGWRAHGVKQYVLIAVLDWRTSTICREKDGQVFNVADAHCDGAKGNYPPFHSFCRTVAAAYFGKDTFVGKHDYNNPLGHAIELPAGTTWHEWEQALIDKYGEEAVELSKEKATHYDADADQYAKFKQSLGGRAPNTLETFQEVKYGDPAVWQRFKDNKYVTDKLASGDWHDGVNPDKQADHIEGTAKDGGSYFAKAVDVEALYNKYKGTGILMRDRNGKPRMVEYIRLKGVDATDVSSIDNTEHQAEGFYIHYSIGKTLRNHLVPTRKVIDYGKTE